MTEIGRALAAVVASLVESGTDVAQFGQAWSELPRILGGQRPVPQLDACVWGHIHAESIRAETELATAVVEWCRKAATTCGTGVYWRRITRSGNDSPGTSRERRRHGVKR